MSSPFFSRRGWEVDRSLERARRLQLDQVAIAILSAAAIVLLTEPGAIARWGFVVGLISQPFWICATWRARQTGMFVVSVLYLPIWIRGILIHFPELRAWI